MKVRINIEEFEEAMRWYKACTPKPLVIVFEDAEPIAEKKECEEVTIRNFTCSKHGKARIIPKCAECLSETPTPEELPRIKELRTTWIENTDFINNLIVASKVNELVRGYNKQSEIINQLRK